MTLRGFAGYDAVVVALRGTPVAERGAESARGRALLREVGAAAVGLPLADVAVETATDGRPLLRAPVLAVPDVSLAHSGGWWLAAVSARGRVGVDVEMQGRVSATVARRFFTAQDNAAAAGRPDATAIRARQWVVKEACLKAAGLTLGEALAGIDVPDAAAGAWRDVAWRVLGLAPGVAAAVACAPALTAPRVRLVRIDDPA